MKPLPALTGFRFIAAFYVFVFHIHLRAPFDFLPVFFQTIISHGALGVNIFFVLSGFILTYSNYEKYTSTSEISWKQFIFKRFAKIYPVYLFGFLCSLAVSIYFNNFPGFTVASLDLLLLEAYVPNLALIWYGGGAWSLSTEFFFYLLFPFMLPLILRINNRIYLMVLLTFLIVLSSIPALAFGMTSEVYNIKNFFIVYAFPLFRLPEFLTGIVAGIIFINHKVKVKEWTALLLVFATIFYVGIYGNKFHGYVIHNVVILPAIIITIWLLAEGKNYLQRILSFRLSVYLGKISYSFFIIQIPLIILIDSLMARNLITKNAIFIFSISLPANLLLAMLVYHLLESPAHSFLLNNRANIKKYQYLAFKHKSNKQ